jgi:Berberine and berberine like
MLVEVLAIFPDRSEPADELRHRDWARAVRESFASALPGGYPNLLGKDDAVRAASSFGGNAARLMEIKRGYDPGNIFSSAIPLPRPARR